MRCRKTLTCSSASTAFPPTSDSMLSLLRRSNSSFVNLLWSHRWHRRCVSTPLFHFKELLFMRGLTGLCSFIFMMLKRQTADFPPGVTAADKDCCGFTYCCRAFSFCWYISTMISFFCWRILNWFSTWLFSLFRVAMACSSSWCCSVAKYNGVFRERQEESRVHRASFEFILWLTYLPGTF